MNFLQTTALNLAFRALGSTNTEPGTPQFELEAEAMEAIDAANEHPRVAPLIMAAMNTLKALGYTYHGGETWKPPLGTQPTTVESSAVQPVTQKKEADLEEMLFLARTMNMALANALSILEKTEKKMEAAK